MFLSDVDIKKAAEDGRITIKDHVTFDEKRLPSVSYGVLLGNKFIIADAHAIEAIDPVKKIFLKTREISIEDYDFGTGKFQYRADHSSSRYAPIAQFTFSELTAPVSHDYAETGRFNMDNWEKNFALPKER